MDAREALHNRELVLGQLLGPSARGHFRRRSVERTGKLRHLTHVLGVVISDGRPDGNCETCRPKPPSPGLPASWFDRICRRRAGQHDQATRAKRCGTEECASAAFHFHLLPNAALLIDKTTAIMFAYSIKRRLGGDSASLRFLRERYNADLPQNRSPNLFRVTPVPRVPRR